MAKRVLVNRDHENSTKIINLPPGTNPGDAVNFGQLQAAIASLTGISIQIPTAIDLSTNPDYPASTPGQSYRVNVSGKIGGASGVDASVGDLIVALTTSVGGTQAAVGSDFEIFNGNVETATETTEGLSRKSTQTETNSGLDDNSFVTPLKLQNKLNNQLACFGILSGNGGDLTTGLPWQSIHDGTGYQHIPLRLHAVIAAPRSMIDAVIAKHELVSNLLLNDWMHLIAIEDGVTYRYTSEGRWETVGKAVADATPELV